MLPLLYFFLNIVLHRNPIRGHHTQSTVFYMVCMIERYVESNL